MPYATKMGQEERQRAAQMYADGQNAEQIAQALDVNPATVRTHLRKLGVRLDRGPRVPPQQLARVIELRAAGSSISFIAESLGLAGSSVRAILAREKAFEPRQPVAEITEEQQQYVIDLYKSGKGVVTISRLLLVPLNSVTATLRRAHVKREHRGRMAKVTSEMAAVMVARYVDGETAEEIAQLIGIGTTSVVKHLRKAGVAVRPKGAAAGVQHPNWKGGRSVTEQGYVQVLMSADDPFYAMSQVKAGNSRYCLEHRLVMARHLGRPLTSEETVHHKDNDPSHNDISNLQLRSGRHGKGSAASCADCGSHNIVFEPLASPTSN